MLRAPRTTENRTAQGGPAPRLTGVLLATVLAVAVLALVVPS